MLYYSTDDYMYLITCGFKKKYRLTRFYKNRPLGHIETEDIEKILNHFRLKIKQFNNFERGE